eukprot:Pgem_evm1s5395
MPNVTAIIHGTGTEWETNATKILKGPTTIYTNEECVLNYKVAVNLFGHKVKKNTRINIDFTIEGRLFQLKALVAGPLKCDLWISYNPSFWPSLDEVDPGTNVFPLGNGEYIILGNPKDEDTSKIVLKDNFTVHGYNGLLLFGSLVTIHPIDHVSVFVDGAAKSNPGEAGYGYLVINISGYGYLGPNTTSNIAEYEGLIEGMEKAKDLHAKNITIYSDSKLVIDQMNGAAQTKHKRLQPLHQKAKQLENEGECKFIFQHIERTKNCKADELANVAVKLKRSLTKFEWGPIKQSQPGEQDDDDDDNDLRGKRLRRNSDSDSS